MGQSLIRIRIPFLINHNFSYRSLKTVPLFTYFVECKKKRKKQKDKNVFFPSSSCITYLCILFTKGYWEEGNEVLFDIDEEEGITCKNFVQFFISCCGQFGE